MRDVDLLIGYSSFRCITWYSRPASRPRPSSYYSIRADVVRWIPIPMNTAFGPFIIRCTGKTGIHVWVCVCVCVCVKSILYFRWSNWITWRRCHSTHTETCSCRRRFCRFCRFSVVYFSISQDLSFYRVRLDVQSRRISINSSCHWPPTSSRGTVDLR